VAPPRCSGRRGQMAIAPRTFTRGARPAEELCCSGCVVDEEEGAEGELPSGTETETC
jgi:hypothetical protein